MMNHLKSAKMLWISLLSIGLVSAILPPEATDKGANGPLLKHEKLRSRRMLRADKIDDKKIKPGTKPKPGVNIVVEEDDETEAAESSEVVETFPHTNSTSTYLEVSNMTNTSTADEALLNETVSDEQLEAESFYSSNVALVTLKNTTPKGLPFFTFTITTDPSTEEIDTSELSSLLSDHLLEQLTEQFPESWLVQLDLDVDYKYKPEKKEVDGVGFEVDKDDNVHIFTATGAVYVQNASTEIPNENQIFAKARDSISKDDAEAAVLSLLQENKDASLQEAKTFTVSEVEPREPHYLLEDSHSIPRTMDIFIGGTAILILLAGGLCCKRQSDGHG